MSLTGLFPIDKWSFKSESVLNDLPDEEFAHLSANMTERQYEKGDVLFREGDAPSGIFFIKKGKVKKYKAGHESKEHIIYVANAGELLGYHAILSEERYPDSAATIEESLIAFIPKKDFLDTLQQSKVLSQRLLKTLSHEFTVLTNSISVFAQRSVRERLAIMLIVLREKFKAETPEGKEITINVSRSDLANMVGTAHENVVRFLKEFKGSGILNTHGRKIFIQDVKKLIEISNYGSRF
jgi:CRP-like cAMP-binding protein